MWLVPSGSLGTWLRSTRVRDRVAGVVAAVLARRRSSLWPVVVASVGAAWSAVRRECVQALERTEDRAGPGPVGGEVRSKHATNSSTGLRGRRGRSLKVSTTDGNEACGLREPAWRSVAATDSRRPTAAGKPGDTSRRVKARPGRRSPSVSLLSHPAGASAALVRRVPVTVPNAAFLRQHVAAPRDALGASSRLIATAPGRSPAAQGLWSGN